MIFDCFPFYNELDLLEMRLRELDGHVDRHVLVESPSTHSGKDKPLYYADNKERFAAWSDKIIHVVLRLPDKLPNVEKPRWVRENMQRDGLRIGLHCAAAKPDDVVLVSDADEIPRGNSVEEFAWHVKRGKQAGGLLRFYYYYLNGFRDYPWRSLIALPAAACIQTAPTEWRIGHMKRTIKMEHVEEAGWHFSFLGGAEVVYDKFGAYAHAEFDNKHYKNLDGIKKRIDAGLDPVGRKAVHVTYQPLNTMMPKDVLARPWAYAHMIRGHNAIASIYG